MSGYTVFISYQLVSTSGYSTAIHCNYIKSIQLTAANPFLQEIYIDFPAEFIFLSDYVSGATGFAVQKIQILVQLVDNSGFINIVDIKPNSALWKIYDVTNQITGYVSGQTLTESNIAGTVFKVSLYNYNSMSTYNLNYLNYPNTNQINRLSFGDETYFFGNVTTDIKAEVYTTDISISLALNEFNSTTNPTWDSSLDSVSISEIGIYDANKNLVAIGKLNDPITKDSTISRTLVFDIDF
jgi:hypothetical protein